MCPGLLRREDQQEREACTVKGRVPKEKVAGGRNGEWKGDDGERERLLGCQSCLYDGKAAFEPSWKSRRGSPPSHRHNRKITTELPTGNRDVESPTAAGPYARQPRCLALEAPADRTT